MPEPTTAARKEPLFIDGIGPPLGQIKEDHSPPHTQEDKDILALIAEIERLLRVEEAASAWRKARASQRNARRCGMTLQPTTAELVEQVRMCVEAADSDIWGNPSILQEPARAALATLSERIEAAERERDDEIKFRWKLEGRVEKLERALLALADDPRTPFAVGDIARAALEPPEPTA